jgi:hypothetical protein
MSAWAVLVSLTFAATIVASDIHIKVLHRDKAFDFDRVHVWAWHPDGAGGVKMALTAEDNPEQMRARIEPTIKQTVQEALAARGLTLRVDEQPQPPDVYITYYVLLSTNAAAETAQMFGATTPEWTLPPVAMPTTNLRIIERGSLVLDVSSAATRTIVWRAVAQAEIDRGRSEPERLDRIQRAIRDLIKRWPK